MQIVAAAIGFLVALGAFLASLLIVLAAPSPALARLAVAATERSVVLIAAAMLAAILALVGMRPGTRAAVGLALLLALGAIGVSLVPAAKALRLAGERRVNLDFTRAIKAALTPPQDTGPRPDQTLTYATLAGQALSVDIYAARPTGPEGTPAILVLHGGTWSGGRRGEGADTSAWLRDQGFTVFDADYRSAAAEPAGGSPTWALAIGDVKCAVTWIKQNAAGSIWNIDPKRVALMGRGAGGHLALLAAYAARDPKLPSTCVSGNEAAIPDATVEAVVAYYAPTDLTLAFSSPPNPRAGDLAPQLSGFLGGTPSSVAAVYKTLSPVERVSDASPRTLLVHGGRDQIFAADHVERLADRLHAAGVHHDTLVIPAAQHRFDSVPHGLSTQLADAVLLRFLESRRPRP